MLTLNPLHTIANGARLPANYLPAALPALQRARPQTAQKGYRPGAEADLSLLATGDWGITVEPVAAEVIAEPALLLDALERFGGNPDGTVIDIGPAVDRPLHLLLDPHARAPDGGPSGDWPCFEDHRTVIGVVDTGIAFWNDVFAVEDRPAFEDVGGMVLEGEADGDSPLRWRGHDAVRRDGIDAPSGIRDRAARAAMGRALPRTAFGPRGDGGPVLPASAPAHGTAMAALVQEGLRRAGHDGPIPMLGLELPQRVLTDAAGSMLAATLDLAVCGLVERAREMGAARVVVLAAFAFTGPQDAPPAVLRRLKRAFDTYADAGIAVDLVMPVGNHLHDRIHAWVRDAASYGGPQLQWRLRPDDHSDNTIDAILPDTRPARIEILAPGSAPGTEAVADLEPGGLWTLRRDGEVVGAVWASELPGADAKDGRLRVRVSLAPTAQAATAGVRLPRATAGRWRIGFPRHESVEAWVLRDDAPFDDPRLAPRRQSWFDDPLYQASSAIGVPSIADRDRPRGPVRRNGTRSPLAHTPVHDATALWRSSAGGVGGPAIYAGLGAGGDSGGRAVVVDGPGPKGGIATVANGTPRRFRVSGTSAAAAIAAGMMAADEAAETA